MRDWAQVHGRQVVDEEAAHAALALFDVDDRGLDRLDRAVLDSLCRRFGGGPVGLSTLAVAVGEEADTVETVAEPFLVREGFITRTPRGRAATALAWEHLGLTPPAGHTAQPSLPLDTGEGRFGELSAHAARGTPRQWRTKGHNWNAATVGHVGRYAVRHLHSGGPPAGVGDLRVPDCVAPHPTAPTRRDCSMTLGMPATLTAVTAPAAVRPWPAC